MDCGRCGQRPLRNGRLSPPCADGAPAADGDREKKILRFAQNDSRNGFPASLEMTKPPPRRGGAEVLFIELLLIKWFFPVPAV